MKSILIRLLIVIGVFIAILYGVGLLLPRSYSIAVSAEIAAPASQVFPEINQLSNWKNWSPWGEQAGLNIEYGGAQAGVGSVQTWSDPRGNGKLWITESVPNELVKYRMYSGGFPEMESSIQLKPAESDPSKTIVTWASEGSLPSGPFYGYFSMLFEPGMQAEYDRGLGKLKSFIESKK